MASRRTRIKGIANIPQRKKAVASTETPLSSNAKLEDDNKDKDTATYVTQNISTEQDNQIDLQSDKPDQQNLTESDLSNSSNNADSTDKETSVALPPEPPPPIIRRKFLKPGINLNVIKQRNVSKEKQSTIVNNNSDPPLQETLQEEKQKINVLNEIRIPKVSVRPTKIIFEPPSSSSVVPCSEVTLNEARLIANDVPQAENSSIDIKKTEPHISDSEYPAPPPSPSKINRSRIKAIPKLSIRKTSCSASESEDESRKYGRIRNNSVCSVASTTCLEPPTSESVPPKEVCQVAPKKVVRTEQSRKLAEARREFHKRFSPHSPDKQKLKMIDLIFYNPFTNPMSQKSNNNNKTEDDSGLTEKNQAEEHVDDPQNQNTEDNREKENDADNSMPVPQIKISASGEIVVDEQSLMVENAELAKQKEQIKNSQIVDGDFDTGYGIYKRAPRMQTWSQKETLRFYRALNLIGTDFSTMTKLFPKRSRRELKMKFKKEERINRQLIDKAITQPCSYNFSDLMREMEVDEEEEMLLQKLKEEELQKLRADRREKKRKLKEAITKSVNRDQNIENCQKQTKYSDLVANDNPKPGKPLKLKQKKKKCLDINSVIEDNDDADISDMTQSDTDEEEIIPFLKPTRSGRMPKSTIKFIEPDEPPRPPKKRLLKQFGDSLLNDAKKPKVPSRDNSPSRLPRNRRFSSTSSVESNSEKLVPGSVVIVNEENLNGQAECKVFMVTPEKKLTPLQLESDVVAKLVKEGQTTSFPVPSVPEKNITIAANEGACIAGKEGECNG